MEHKSMNIYQRILAIMKDIDYVQKGDKRVGNQYTYVSHDQVTGAIHPLLVKHGVVLIPTVKSLSQEGNRTSVCVCVMAVNAENPEDFFTWESWGYGVDSSDKGPGKAVSYAFKYAVLKLLCLETGEDPDNDQQSKFEASNESVAPTTPSDSETKITLASFKSKIMEKFGGKYSLERLGEYVEETAKWKSLPEQELMKQASSPPLIGLFCNAYEIWYKDKNKS